MIGEETQDRGSTAAAEPALETKGSSGDAGPAHVFGHYFVCILGAGCLVFLHGVAPPRYPSTRMSSRKSAES